MPAFERVPRQSGKYSPLRNEIQREKVGPSTEGNNAQENSTFCHTISPSGVRYKENPDG